MSLPERWHYCHLHNTDWQGFPKCPSCPDEKPRAGMRPGYDYPVASRDAAKAVEDFKARLAERLRKGRPETDENGLVDLDLIIELVGGFE